MSLHAGNDILIGKFFCHIDDIELVGAAVFCALIEVVKLFFLSAVDTYADDVKTIVFLQPGNDRCCVQTAAVCQNNFFVCSAHDKKPPVFLYYYLQSGQADLKRMLTAALTVLVLPIREHIFNSFRRNDYHYTTLNILMQAPKCE